jgi:hypothetical protein
MWQDSTVGGTWANVTGGTGATTADYTTAALTVKTFYRAKVSQTGIPSVFVYSTVVTVTVNSLPATPTITKTNPAPSFANLLTSSLATSYQWYNSSGIITGATSRTYTVTANGSYYVIVKNANGCSSAASNTIVISNVGIDFLSGNSFNIYPNPVNNFLSVELNSVSNTVISILDIIGNKVLEVIPTDNTTNINLSSLSSGVYMIRVMQNGKISTQKLIKE